MSKYYCLAHKYCLDNRKGYRYMVFNDLFYCYCVLGFVVAIFTVAEIALNILHLILCQLEDKMFYSVQKS
jgi:hypothetical protein